MIWELDRGNIPIQEETVAWWDKETKAIEKAMRKRREHVSGVQYHKEVADTGRGFGSKPPSPRSREDGQSSEDDRKT